MRGIYRFYDKKIAGGKGFFTFSILCALSIRCAYLLHTELLPTSSGITEGYFWKLVAPLFSNTYASVIGGALFLSIVAFMVHVINVRYVFIRKKTLLPSAIVILIFSLAPSYIIASPLYICALVMLWVAYSFFDGYTAAQKQMLALKVSFNLSLGSLFVPLLMLYLPILWFCLARIRGLNLKSFLASLFGILVVYIPTLTAFSITGKLDDFLIPFASLSDVDWVDIPLLNYEPLYAILIAFMVILFFIILVDNYIYRYKDKVKVRAYLSILTIIIACSVLAVLFLNIDPFMFGTVTLALGALHMGHFFALTELRPIIILFFICIIMLLFASVFPFF